MKMGDEIQKEHTHGFQRIDPIDTFLQQSQTRVCGFRKQLANEGKAMKLMFFILDDGRGGDKLSRAYLGPELEFCSKVFQGNTFVFLKGISNGKF